MPCAALPSGVTGIISLVFGIMFWVQYGNVKDACEDEGSERVFAKCIEDERDHVEDKTYLHVDART